MCLFHNSVQLTVKKEKKNIGRKSHNWPENLILVKNQKHRDSPQLPSPIICMYNQIFMIFWMSLNGWQFASLRRCQSKGQAPPQREGTLPRSWEMTMFNWQHLENTLYFHYLTGWLENNWCISKHQHLLFVSFNQSHLTWQNPITGCTIFRCKQISPGTDDQSLVQPVGILAHSSMVNCINPVSFSNMNCIFQLVSQHFFRSV